MRKFGLFLFVTLMLSISISAATLNIGDSQAYTFTAVGFPDSSATATFTLLDANSLGLTYTNTSTNGTYLTGFGFNTTPNLSGVVGVATNGWTASTGPGGGLGNYELIDYGNGAANRLADGESGSALFTFTNSVRSLSIDTVIAHLTSLPNEGSQKPTGVPYCPTQPTPEPASMLLLGTGIAGIAAKLRKRKNAA